jgi:hypothetical protein
MVAFHFQRGFQSDEISGGAALRLCVPVAFARKSHAASAANEGPLVSVEHAIVGSSRLPENILVFNGPVSQDDKGRGQESARANWRQTEAPVTVERYNHQRVLSELSVAWREGRPSNLIHSAKWRRLVRID